MKQRKLKGYVLPTIYVIILMLVFGTVSLVSTLLKENPNYLYSIGILNGSTTPVVDTTKPVKTIGKPYASEKVAIDKSFYDVNETEEKQANSLIYFENTYMKNTGVLYKSDEAFDCVAVLDGVVASIKDDEILGKVVEVEHSTNLRTIYYTLKETNLKVGDNLLQGDVIGVSGSSRISDAKNTLLFEVYYNGILINPENFYSMNIDELQ